MNTRTINFSLKYRMSCILTAFLFILMLLISAITYNSDPKIAPEVLENIKGLFICKS
jgi:hypothetical protein